MDLRPPRHLPPSRDADDPGALLPRRLVPRARLVAVDPEQSSPVVRCNRRLSRHRQRLTRHGAQRVDRPPLALCDSTVGHDLAAADLVRRLVRPQRPDLGDRSCRHQVPLPGSTRWREHFDVRARLRQAHRGPHAVDHDPSGQAQRVHDRAATRTPSGRLAQRIRNAAAAASSAAASTSASSASAAGSTGTAAPGPAATACAVADPAAATAATASAERPRHDADVHEHVLALLTARA